MKVLNMSITPKTSITLSKSAESMLKRNTYLNNKSARISEIITRYGMLLNAHRNEYIDTFINDKFVRSVILDSDTVYPIPAMHLRDALQFVANERLNNGEEMPSKTDMNTLFERSAKLTPFDQMVIVEAIEASASR
jgi:hypothetical protein